MSLIKDMQRIAAKKLKNTRGVPKNLKEKLELIDLAFGHAAVLVDFDKWCEENADRNLPYPVTEYIRRIDARLGSATTVEAADDRVTELRALTFSLTEVMPRLEGVRNLLAIHTLEEIKEALIEYLPTVKDGNMNHAVRNFYDDLGATAVIYARRRRDKKS